MAITYGNLSKIPKLSPGAVGSAYVAPKHKGSEELIPSWATWLLTGLEIAALFIPGVGEAVSAGLATVQAGIGTAEMAQNGKIDPLNMAMLWGGVAISGGAAIRGIYKDVKVFENVTSRLGKKLETATDLKEIGLIRSGIQKTEMAKSTLEKFGNTYSKLPSGFGGNTAYLKGFVKGVAKGGGLQIQESMSKLVITSLRKGASAAAEAAEQTRQIRKEIKVILGKDLFEELIILSKTFGRISLSRSSVLLRRFLSKLSKAQLEELKMLSGGFARILSPIKSLKKITGLPQNTWRMMKSSKFYQNEVQWIQNINASDFGRFLAEKGYGIMRHGFITKGNKVIIKGLDNSKTIKLMRKFVRNMIPTALLKEGKFEKAFVESGGTLLNSEYLLGYKILNSAGIGHFQTHEVLVKFHKGATTANTAHLSHGKDDIIITATTQDLESLVAEGSSYWFRVGAAKGWFTARGGKSVENSVSGMTSKILSFLPVQFIRSFGSMVSNFKAFSDMWFKGGGGSSQWTKEFVSNIKNTGYNRLGRIATAGVLGNVGGKWLGRSSQQVVTAGINSLTKGQNFKHTLIGSGKSMWKNTIIGKRLMSDAKRTVFKGTGKRSSRLTGTRKIQISKSAIGWYKGW